MHTTLIKAIKNNKELNTGRVHTINTTYLCNLFFVESKIDNNN